MKRLITFSLALILALSSISCTSKNTQYTTDGVYYCDGTVITEDGNEWSYDSYTINGDGIAVIVRFDNNGTIDITDDIILSVNYKEYPCK